MTDHPRDSAGLMRVVVAGGGIAGAEALLALREFAGDRVSLTLVSPSDDLVVPALSVAESFALGHAPRYPWRDLLEHVDAELVSGSVAEVDAQTRQIRLDGGATVGFDALVIATGARPVARVANATTWWPNGSTEEFGGLLRDLEEGYIRRLAFVIPPGAVWPLPLYELALMTAREVSGMGIDDAQMTVITPEAVPLALFGSAAATALQEELENAGIGLEVASTARVERGAGLAVVLDPSGRRVEVDRVVALPGVDGPRIPGTTHNESGFILVGEHGQMRGSDSVWAAGDAIAYPVKFGGLASQQADAVAADIARRAGAHAAAPPENLQLRGVLMTGGAPRELGSGPAAAGAAGAGESAAPTRRRPIWRPREKVFGTFLTPFLHGRSEATSAEDETAAGVIVEETLPGPEHGDEATFHALWRSANDPQDRLRSLGRAIHDYEQKHQQAASILRDHGQLGR